MMMMEGPSHFETERDWHWAGDAAAAEDLGDDSLMWLNDAVENSLMGLNIQAAREQPGDDLVRSEQALKAPFAASATGTEGNNMLASVPAQSPAFEAPAQYAQEAQRSYMSKQTPLEESGWKHTHVDVPSLPNTRAPSAAPVQPSAASQLSSSPMALQTPQRLSGPPSSSTAKSSSSSSSANGARKPRKPRATIPTPPITSPTLTSPSPSTSAADVDDSASKRSPSARIDVRFIPQNPAIAELVRCAGYCPKLELKTPSTKRVGFFFSHLNKKWSNVSIIDKLQLFLAPASPSSRSSPDGKVPLQGPPLSADVTLDSLSQHFDIQASKARPILFICYSLPVEPAPRPREGSNWACQDLSNLLCGEPQEQVMAPLQPQAYTLSAEDASLLLGLPDVSFSLPDGSKNTHSDPITPAPPSFCWRSELGSLRASASHTSSSSDYDTCKTTGLPTSSPKKRPLYSGNQGIEQTSERTSYQPNVPCASYSQDQGVHVNGHQVETEQRKAPGSDKKKRRIAPVLVSTTLPAFTQEPCKENMQYMC